jgi:catechol 2,3-dioxygenase
MKADANPRPKLQHVGLFTANLDAMIDWYGKVLGMTVNYRRASDQGRRNGPPFSIALIGNDEMHHRIALLGLPGLTSDPEKSRHVRVQHIAFECDTIDDLLGTYLRLKGLGILPKMAGDELIQMVLYYQDPDQNVVEINVNNFADQRIAMEQMKNAPSDTRGLVLFDPEKVIAARKAGASHGELHERALAGEFAPAMPPDPRSLL